MEHTSTTLVAKPKKMRKKWYRLFILGGSTSMDGQIFYITVSEYQLASEMLLLGRSVTAHEAHTRFGLCVSYSHSYWVYCETVVSLSISYYISPKINPVLLTVAFFLHSTLSITVLISSTILGAIRYKADSLFVSFVLLSFGSAN